MTQPKTPAKEQPKKTDADHHTREWSSGKRGGGKVPPDFSWNTNPKQNQEEHGTSEGAKVPKKSE